MVISSVLTIFFFPGHLFGLEIGERNETSFTSKEVKSNDAKSNRLCKLSHE